MLGHLTALGSPAGDTDCTLLSQVLDQEAYQRIQQAVEASPADFWGPIAARELHWFHASPQAWLTRIGDGWVGWHTSGMPTQSNDELVPWTACLDESESPFVRWFVGGLTNAAFNEVDRHVLQEHDSAAFITDSGDGMCECMTLRTLLFESVLVACALKQGYDISSKQLIALYLPCSLCAVVWIEAAKRVGVPFIAISSGTTSHSLATRLADTRASVIVTIDTLASVTREAIQLMPSTAPTLVVEGSPSAAARHCSKHGCACCTGPTARCHYCPHSYPSVISGGSLRQRQSTLASHSSSCTLPAPPAGQRASCTRTVATKLACV